MKELVFIAHRLPYPPNKGEKLRAYHFLKFLATHYPTHLVCHVDEERDLKALKEIDIPLASFHYHFSPRAHRKRRCLKALVTGQSLTVAYFYDPPLQRALARLLAQRPIGLVFCSCAPSAEYIFRAGFSGPKFMDFMDVDSQKWADFSRETSLPMRWVYAIEARRHRSYEKKIAQAFDQVFFVTEAEAHLFRKKVCDPGNVSVIENGVDLECFSPVYQSPLPKKGPTLVFTGAMDYWPNVEGVLWFVREIFPKIRQEIPEIELFIVGKDPSSEIQKLGRKAHIHVTGYVSDARDYLALADVSIVPLRLARGVQNKILEALAMGKPVVATSAAAEGIKAKAGKHLLVADNPKAFAEAVVKPLKDPLYARRMGDSARKLMEEQYNWEKNLAFLEDFLP